jgi:predicted alpha/beta-fold hydrolase
MGRIAGKLQARGVRTFRMDLRGCGAGLTLARYPYHSGRSADAMAALQVIRGLCPGSPLSLIGFSLGGNITLKLLGEAPQAVPSELQRAVAVCPPVDLRACVESLRRGINRLYDRYFARLLRRQLIVRQRAHPATIVPPGWPGSNDNQPAPVESVRRGVAGRSTIRYPRGILEFDEAFTAPVCGFGTADNYYRLSSSAQFIPAIRVPTLILAAADDPLVPCEPFQRLNLPQSVCLQMTGSGGHLGYLGRGGTDPDRRWMDWRIVDWCCDANSRQ